MVGVISDLETLVRYRRVPRSKRVADIVELRLDSIPGRLHDRSLELCRQLEADHAEVLVTIRLKAEGGDWGRNDHSRLGLFQRALDVASFVDVEESSTIVREVVREAHARGKKVVVSYHNHRSTPDLGRLVNMVRRCCAMKADIVKIATMINSTRDHLILHELLASRSQRALCVIGMGAMGISTRTYFPAIGSCLAYGYLDTPSAPGQLSCGQLREFLRLACRDFSENRRLKPGWREIPVGSPPRTR